MNLVSRVTTVLTVCDEIQFGPFLYVATHICAGALLGTTRFCEFQGYLNSLVARDAARFREIRRFPLGFHKFPLGSVRPEGVTWESMGSRKVL